MRQLSPDRGPDDERWDEAKAHDLVGALVLIGVTYVAADGSCRRQQMFGTVAHIDRGRGIDIALGGKRAGEHFRLPPDSVVFRRAAPGHYRLHDTGELVVDPAFLVTYDVHAPRDT